MVLLKIRNKEGEVQEVEVTQNMSFEPVRGQQFYFNNAADSYYFQLTDNEESIKLIFKSGDETIELYFKDMATLIQENDPNGPGNLLSVLAIANDDKGWEEMEAHLADPNFEGGEIIADLKAKLTAELLGQVDEGIVVDDFGALVEKLAQTAAGYKNVHTVNVK